MTRLDGTIPDPEREELLFDLAAENTFLEKIVNCIPANVYFDKGLKDKIISEKHSVMNKKAKGLKRNHTDLSAKSKHKRARLDPECQKSVSQVHEELNKRKIRKKKKGLLLLPASQQRATNIEELQQKLKERISEFKTKRNGCSRNDPLKKKLKTKEKKMKRKKVVLAQANEAAMQANKAAKEKKTPVKKGQFNEEGKVIYGMLDFTDESIRENKKKKNEFGGNKYKKLLQKAEKHQEEIEDLKKNDPEKATSIIEKEKWKKAILKSENVKVKDNPELLKKSLKKQEKMKKRKAKAWKERVDNVEEKKKKRQEKRTKNLQKRKKEKLEHKIKHAKKRGRVITGV